MKQTCCGKGVNKKWWMKGGRNANGGRRAENEI
jgi:hypothetical protein